MDRTAALQNASTALEVDEELWVGAPFDERIGYLIARWPSAGASG